MMTSVSEFLEIVNLAVKNSPNGLFRVRHRLMAAGQINDGEPAETQAERAIEKIAFVIRAAMKHRARHPPDCLRVNRFIPGKIKLAANPAHFVG
jgi:hypothetical protein